jgi:hypothetical protein
LQGCWAGVLAAVPAGWKVITDKKKTCQSAVPPDWAQDKLITGSATSPDGKSNLVIHGNEQPLAEIKPMIQQTIPPDNTIEDNGKRYCIRINIWRTEALCRERTGMWRLRFREVYAPHN